MENLAAPPLVMIFDDQIDVAVGLANLVETWGYRASTAGDAQTCIDMAATERVDIFVLDIAGADKYALAEAMMMSYPDAVFIGHSGDPEDEKTQAAALFDHIIRKPFGYRDLEKLLRDITNPQA